MKEIESLEKRTKINNSYETDSMSTSSNEIHVEKRTYNLNKKTIKILDNEKLESKVIKKYEVSNTNSNTVLSGEEYSLKKTFKIIENGLDDSQVTDTDSEEDDDDEQYDTTDYEKDELTESDEDDKEETNIVYGNKKIELNPEESNHSLKFKICSKIVEGETIYEMVSIENSCNAVDMNMTKINKNENDKELSFDGKINFLKEKNIIYNDQKMFLKNKIIDNKNMINFSDNITSNTELAIKTGNNLNSATKNIKGPKNIKGTINNEINKTTLVNEINKTISIDDKTTQNFTNKLNNVYIAEYNFVGDENKFINNETHTTSQNNQTIEENENIRFQNFIISENLQNSNMIQSNNELSPDLFDGEYTEYDRIAIQNLSNVSLTSLLKEQLNESIELHGVLEKRDQELLKRVQKSLTGIPPPPSKTIVELNLFELISLNKNKILNFFKKSDDNLNEPMNDCLFKPTVSFDEMSSLNWPNLLQIHYHGISYNVCKASETAEYLSMSVVDRYIGSQTKSSYISSPSSTKKRTMRLKQLTQSPGSRLSHLAKRRAIFSSANLQSNNQKTLGISGSRQIILDNGKNRNKRKILTPRRLTPNARKRIYGRNTPTSSAKKRLLFRNDLNLNQKPGPSRENSKRALFQSPPHQKTFQSKPQNIKPQIKPEIANRVEKSRRALFSPDAKFTITALSQPDLSQPNLSQSCNLSQMSILGGSSINLYNHSKRKRDNENSTPIDNQRKLYRLDSSNSLSSEPLTPKSLKVKSQSFCIGSDVNRGNSMLNNSICLTRARSDNTFTSHQLTDSHKKKLLWAVSSALQKKQIGVTHPDFKRHASTLAKALKRLFVEFYKKSPSTSETLLRLSKKYVYSAINGKSVDYIYFAEKRHIENEKMLNSSKLSGYIAPEQYDNLKTKLSGLQKSTSSLLLENSMESTLWTNEVENKSFNSQLLSEESISEYNNIISSQIHQQNSAIKLAMQPNKSLQNSSSKNNLKDFVLKENIFCEQRKSAQKCFTGKDQKNVSPYKSPYHYSTEKNLSKQPTDFNSGSVKRQILFDY